MNGVYAKMGTRGFALLLLVVNVFGAIRSQESSMWPPWKTERNPAMDKGVVFTVPQVDNMPDFHGNPLDARLVILAGGNYFFAMDELVAAFEERTPAVRGRVFYETIPPGIVARQLENGGTITVGNLTLSVRADVVQAGSERIDELIGKELLDGPAVRFATNDLAIMVAAGNPKGIRSLQDLARPGVRLANPDPQTEGIAKQIKQALRKAGGEELVARVYEDKVKSGEAVMTQIHHRQTPLWIMQGEADAGVTWASEPKYQQMIGHLIATVEIPDEHNQQGSQAAAVAKNAPNRQAAKEWLDFLRSPAAGKILERYGMQTP